MIRERPYRRRVMLNTAATGAGNMWAMVVTLVTLPFVLEGLGADQFGVWVILQTFSAMNGWFSIASIGLATVVTKEIAAAAGLEDRARCASLLRWGAFRSLVLGVLGIALFVAVGPSVVDALTRGGRLSWAVTAAFATQIAVDTVLVVLLGAVEGRQRIDISRGVDAVRRTASSVTVAVVVQLGGGLRAASVAALSASVLGLLLAAAANGPSWRGANPHPAIDSWPLYRYAAMTSGLIATGVAHRTMDRLIVGAMLGASSVALVEVATQLQNGALAVLTAASYGALSSASWVRSRRDPAAERDLIVAGTRYSLLAAMLPTVVGIVLAPQIIELWVGSDYGEAAALARVALLFVIAAGPVAVASNYLQGIGRADRVLRAALVGIVANLALSVALVDLLGIAGTFWGTFLAALISLPLLLWPALDVSGVTPGLFIRRGVAPVLPPTVFGVFLCWIVTLFDLAPLPTVVLAVGAAAPIYVVLGVRLAVDADDRSALLAGLRRGSRTPGDG